MTVPKIDLFLASDTEVEDTCSWFFINWEKLELEDIRIFTTEDGFDVEHELMELDLLITVLRTEPKVAEYDWLTCRILFHRIIEGKDVPKHISPHG